MLVLHVRNKTLFIKVQAILTVNVSKLVVYLLG